METWRDVIGYENIYEVSNEGRIRNAQSKRLLSPGTSQGYHYVALYKNGIRKNKQVHRLVADAFIENPRNYPILNHKDENRKNNCVGNLEWCSYAYNNTYNGVARKRGEKIRGKSTWNKGKNMSDSFKQKVSEGMRRHYRENAGSSATTED